ncbi:MAG: peptide/nickel transport system permease protein [Rhodospirillaceae bacterium]|jgi:peptide/nickel transport system permease protein|nr:peptide/nickel transport system permease protein [Rhodospirillaceae bacterium]
MPRLILGRLASFAVTLLASSVIVFIVLDILPGDPAAILLGTSARPDTLAALRHQLGLDRPLLLQYLDWIGGALTGDFGTSVTYGVPVGSLIAERLAITVPLAILAILLSTMLALGLGVWAAANQDRTIDHAVKGFAQLSVAVPDFWIGLLLILFFSTFLHWFSAGGWSGWSADPGQALKGLLLPAIALALPQAGVLTRVARSAVLDVMGEDFVRTARAKGLDRRATLWRHVVPNALIPVVTIIGLQFSFLIAGAVLVENVFSLPGLGRLAYLALAQRDLVVLRNVVMLFAAMVIAVNFAVDLVYLSLDPRLRART